MASYQMDASRLQSMFISGSAALEANKSWINDLNVFPVPDGDTGTNMTMTLNSAVRELGKLSDPDMQAVTKAISFAVSVILFPVFCAGRSTGSHKPISEMMVKSAFRFISMLLINGCFFTLLYTELS